MESLRLCAVDKAADLDDFSMGFFHYWKIVKEDVNEYLQELSL